MLEAREQLEQNPGLLRKNDRFAGLQGQQNPHQEDTGWQEEPI